MNILKKIYNFFRQTLLELRKVDWLSRRLTIRYTLLILICLVLGTLFVMFIDQVFVALRGLIL